MRCVRRIDRHDAVILVCSWNRTADAAVAAYGRRRFAQMLRHCAGVREMFQAPVANASALPAIIALRVAKIIGAADQCRKAIFIDRVNLPMLNLVRNPRALFALNALGMMS